MLKNMRIGVRLTLGFGVVIVMLVVMSAFAINQLGQSKESMDLIVYDRFPKTVEVSKIQMNLNRIARSMRNIIILDKAEDITNEIKRIEEAKAGIRESLENLDKTIKSEKGRQLYKDLLSSREKYFMYQEKFMKDVERDITKKNELTALLIVDIRPLQLAYFDALSSLSDYQKKLMEDAGEQAKASYYFSRNLLTFLGLLSILFGFGMSYWITRSITKPINEAVEISNKIADGDLTEDVTVNSKDETGKMMMAFSIMSKNLNEILGNLNIAVDEMQNGASQISDASQSLSQGSTEQAASVEEISAAITELASQTRQAAANAKRANELSNNTLESSKKGGEMMNELMTAMHQIKSAADNISKIIKAIDEIAFQTNLLSLNAAVEAARAGRHGKGFAVVAEEVKSLSDRSAKAARETADLIQESINRANNGAAIAEKTVSSLFEISNSVEEVANLMKEVAIAAEEQTSGLIEVEKSIQQIEQVTQGNAANSEETASASAELASQAESINEMVGKFKLKQDYHPEETIKKKKNLNLHKKQNNNGHLLDQVNPKNVAVVAKNVKEKVNPESVISLEDHEFGKY